MRAQTEKRLAPSTRLSWLVALLATAAVLTGATTAFGAGETAEGTAACNPESGTVECVVTTGVEDGEIVATPDGQTPTPAPIVPATPAEPVTPVVPTPRIETPDPVPVATVEDIVAPADPAPLVPAAPDQTPRPDAPLVADSPLSATTGDGSVTAAAPDQPPAVPGVPDAPTYSAADAPPPLLPESGAADVAPVKLLAAKATLDPAAFTKASADGLGKFEQGLSVGSIEGMSLEEIFAPPVEWIAPVYHSPGNLLEVLATYFVPGDGGSYTATLAALLQIAFVLVAWLLVRPRPISSPMTELRSSRAVGYRAVVFRPG
jgi:hypothetical protein